MLRSLRLPTLATAIALGLLGCRSDDSTSDDTPDPDGGTDGTIAGTRIQDVQSDAMVPGTPVELRGVVVTHIDTFGARIGNFYVQEPEGGEFSGILVFGASLDQVAQLQVGDLVDITGAEKDEFGLEADDKTVTELVELTGGEMTVTRVGTMPVPAPHVLDALTIGRMATEAREAEYEKWEGVLVQVNNVSVNRGIQPITSSNADDCTFRDFIITGSLYVDSSYAAIPATLPMSAECPAEMNPNLVSAGDCLASITGMGDYFFNYKVLPRTTADIVTGGTGCPAPENTMALCTDTIDNDANGFTDCDDRNCAATCATGTTIEMVQAGTATGVVTLDNVVVTGVDLVPNSYNVWVSQTAQAAPNQGLIVFMGPSMPTVTIGQVVDVTGTVVEFDAMPPSGDTLTELTNATITVDTGTMTPLPVTGVPAGTLAMIGAAGEPYESVLVRLTNLRVMAETSPGDRVVLSDGTSTIVMDDDIFNYAAGAYPVGTCFSSAVGIMHLNVFDDERRFLPRSASDLTMVACP